MSQSDQLPVAERAYQAYGNATDHRNFRGEPMPAWDDLPQTIQDAWTAAADAVLATPPVPVEYGEIQVTRHLGRGIVVDIASENAKASIAILASTDPSVRIDNGAVRIADQVLYEITGYDPADATLTLRLVRDWRPGQKDDPASEASLAETCATFSEHGWGRCVEPRDHTGSHFYRAPQGKRES